MWRCREDQERWMRSQRSSAWHGLESKTKACVLFDTDGYYQALKKIFEEMVEVGFSEKEDFKRVLVSADLDEIECFIEQ